ncbi:hypothetical protein D9M68_907750 [compost metagenome]
MQVELPLQVAQLLCAGIMQADPDEVAGFAGPLESFIEGYVGDSLAFGVYSGGNDSTHGSAVPSSVIERMERSLSLSVI